MAKLTFDKVVSGLTKVLNDLDKVIESNKAESEAHTATITDLQAKKQNCDVEISRSEKVKSNLSAILGN